MLMTPKTAGGYRRRCRPACPAAVLVLLVAAGCSKQPPAVLPLPTEPANVLAVVGNEPITAEEFSAAMHRRRLGGDPMAKRMLLDEMIQARELVQEARQRGYDRDPELLAAFENLLANKVRQGDEAALRALAKVEPSEVEAYYQAHPAEFSTPGKRRLAMIFVEAPKSFSAQAQAERRASADAARQKALALPPGGPGFGAVAAEYSYDQSTKFVGGDVGYLTDGALYPGWDKPVMDAAAALAEAGQVSGVIDTERGYYLLRLTSKQAAAVQPIAAARVRIERQIRQEKEQRLTARLADERAHRENVKVFDDRLKEVPVPQAAREEADSPPAVP